MLVYLNPYIRLWEEVNGYTLDILDSDKVVKRIENIERDNLLQTIEQELDQIDAASVELLKEKAIHINRVFMGDIVNLLK